MKDMQYFSHDSNARGDPKTKYLISTYGMRGYGMYWVIIEILRDQDGFKLPVDDITLSCLADDFRISFDETKAFIDDCINKFKLLKSDGRYMWSESLLSRMKKMIDSKEKRSAAGKKGMESRWGNKTDSDNNVITMLYQSSNNVIENDNAVITTDNKEINKEINIYSSSSAGARDYNTNPSESQDVIGEVFKFFHENINSTPGPFQYDRLGECIDFGISPEVMIEAMKDSIGAKYNKWGLLDTKLQDCIDNKILTIEKYNARKLERARDKPGRSDKGGGSSENIKPGPKYDKSKILYAGGSDIDPDKSVDF